jgi:hypothetical protein
LIRVIFSAQAGIKRAVRSSAATIETRVRAHLLLDAAARSWLLQVLDEGDDERALCEEDAGHPLDDGECLIAYGLFEGLDLRSVSHPTAEPQGNRDHASGIPSAGRGNHGGVDGRGGSLTPKRVI